jgi:cytochrome c553
MASHSAGRALVGLGLLALPLSATAADLGATIAKQGNGQGATACQTCHGADGSGNAAAGFPRLAGMNADYLAKQLRDLQGDARNNATMNPIAASLTAKEIDAVAAYYSGMTPPAKAPGSGDASDQQLSRGEAIAERGLWGKGVPACTSCHGPGGRGVGAAFPGLAGQHAGYISAQIQAWKDDKRSNDPNQLMDTVAEKLSAKETAAAAAYFASLPATGADQ